MKTLFKFLFIFFIVGFLSCENEDTLLDNDLSPSSTKLGEDKAIIKQLGFDISSLVDEGDVYVLEGDVVLEKKHLKEYGKTSEDTTGNSSTLKQARTSALVSQTNVRNMTVGIHASVPLTGAGSDWRTAITNALNQWNSAPGCAIKFVLSASSSPDILINYSYINSSGTIARASFPLNNKPGNTVTINTEYNSLSASKKLFTVIHELGHCVGLRHTDWETKDSPEGQSSSGAIYIPGTPVRDSYSFMNSIVADWNRFSDYDVKALQFLYPDNYTIIASRESINYNESTTFYFNTANSEVTRVVWEFPSYLKIQQSLNNGKEVVAHLSTLTRLDAPIIAYGYDRTGKQIAVAIMTMKINYLELCPLRGPVLLNYNQQSMFSYHIPSNFAYNVTFEYDTRYLSKISSTAHDYRSITLKAITASRVKTTIKAIAYDYSGRKIAEKESIVNLNH